MVKEFWEAMPHGKDLVTGGDMDWSQELTMGDRTSITKGSRENKDKWVVHFQGNNQSLSTEAVMWLKEKGFIS